MKTDVHGAPFHQENAVDAIDAVGFLLGGFPEHFDRAAAFLRMQIPAHRIPDRADHAEPACRAWLHPVNGLWSSTVVRKKEPK